MSTSRVPVPPATNGTAYLERVSSGIPGLDEVLEGGYLASRTYLISGPPGTGKTTLGWHFLCEGIKQGEAALFVTFGEPESDLRENAALSGFDTTGASFVDLSPSGDLFKSAESYDIFSPAEVERDSTNARIVEAVERIKPRRVFVDSMTHLRYLAADTFQYRRQALSFLRYLGEQGAVVLLSSESTRESSDDDLRFLADGVIEVSLGDRSRMLAVSKFRGSAFRTGRHAFSLGAAGATVYPRLIPRSHKRAYDEETFSSGIPNFDTMMNGGIERGTITLVSGPSGVGKTTLCMQIMKEAAARGDRSVVYTFDESAETILRRCQAIDIPARAMVERGTLLVSEIESLRFGPDEFASVVREDVEKRDTKIVLIDSISGYRISVAGDDLVMRLHALCKYLVNVGVTVLLVNELQDPLAFRISEIGISYLADNIVFLRYLERSNGVHGELGKGVGVLKKRLSDFERSLRELNITERGVHVGDPLPVKAILGALPVEDGATSNR